MATALELALLPKREPQRLFHPHASPTPGESVGPPDPIVAPALRLYVALATFLCCNSNMEALMTEILKALFHRRAVKAFEPVEIPQPLREQILDAARHAPSSFNMQPYRFFWVESSPRKATAAKLCLV